MTRKDLFEAIRPFAPGRQFLPAQVQVIDALADAFGLDREGTPGLKVSRAGLELIKSFEGCRLEAYPDPGTGGDPWTIGWGSTGPGIRKGVVWTQEQADSRFREDVDAFAQGVTSLIGTAPTSQGQFDAMTSLAYNVGLGNFRESTLLRLHKEGDYAGAAAQFSRWNKAAGRVLPGLTRRRAAEAKLYGAEA